MAKRNVLKREVVKEFADKLFKKSKRFTQKEFDKLRCQLAEYTERGVTRNALRRHLKRLQYRQYRKSEKVVKPKLKKEFLGKNKEVARIGVVSRLDYGSEGFRAGLLQEMKEVFEDAGVDYVLILGGLFAGKVLEQLAPKKKHLVQHEEFIRKAALELSHFIPKMKTSTGKRMPIFIVISAKFDKDIGYEIARHLSKLRQDINLRGIGKYRFFVDFNGKEKQITALVPQRGRILMRGKYCSTHTQRVLDDWRSITSHPYPDICVVGCFGVGVAKPKGESPEAYVSIPALHKLSGESTMENQIGVTILEFTEDTTRSIFYDMKHLVRDDRGFIQIPEEIIGNSLLVAQAIQQNGGLTVGLLVDRIEKNTGKKITYAQVREAIKELSYETAIRIIVENESEGVYKLSEYVRSMTGRYFSAKDVQTILAEPPDVCMNWPGITYNDDTDTYDFDLEWMQRHLRYNFYEELRNPDVKVDRLVGFGCLHATAADTDYEFFLRHLPAYILEHNVEHLFGVGDFIEGMFHDLILKGEVIGGANLSKQEEIAGRLIENVLIQVFEARFRKEMAKVENLSELSDNEVFEKVEQSLIHFYYIPGNHCMWSERQGYTALTVFDLILRESLKKSLSRVVYELTGKDLKMSKIVDKKIQRRENQVFSLPSGVTAEMFHPHMSRAQTHSARAQQALWKSKAQLVLTANYHTSAFVCEYHANMGQRVSVQFGTIKQRSNFEDYKLKTVDKSVGGIVIWSLNGRILAVQNEFYGDHKSDPIMADRVIQFVVEKFIGIDLDE